MIDEAILQHGGHIGVLGIFVLMALKEVLSFADKHDEKGCIFPESGIEQLNHMYIASIRSDQQFERLLASLERICDRLERGDCPYE